MKKIQNPTLIPYQEKIVLDKMYSLKLKPKKIAYFLSISIIFKIIYLSQYLKRFKVNLKME